MTEQEASVEWTCTLLPLVLQEEKHYSYLVGEYAECQPLMEHQAMNILKMVSSVSIWQSYKLQ